MQSSVVMWLYWSEVREKHWSRCCCWVGWVRSWWRDERGDAEWTMVVEDATRGREALLMEGTVAVAVLGWSPASL